MLDLILPSERPQFFGTEPWRCWNHPAEIWWHQSTPTDLLVTDQWWDSHVSINPQGALLDYDQVTGDSAAQQTYCWVQVLGGLCFELSFWKHPSQDGSIVVIKRSTLPATMLKWLRCCSCTRSALRGPKLCKKIKYPWQYDLTTQHRFLFSWWFHLILIWPSECCCRYPYSWHRQHFPNHLLCSFCVHVAVLCSEMIICIDWLD